MPVSVKEFSEKIRQNPLAKSQAGLERLAIGIKRLLNVLETETIAAIRTLEMKISDAGPLNQRVEPHILGLAGVELMERRRVKPHTHIFTGTHSWYAPIRLTADQVAEKLESLVEAYLATTNAGFTSALGDPLEISIFKILQRLKASDRRFTYLGSFDLSERGANGRYKKTEPTIDYNDAQLDGPPDYTIFDPTSGEPGIIECKNHREWVYPSSKIVKTLVAKAIAAQATPILIARRMPYITKMALCEPAGIIAHETYNQLYPDTEEGRQLAATVAEVRGLGYFDVRASEEPLQRSQNFFETNLPKLLPIAATKFAAATPWLKDWVESAMSWSELRQRLAGTYVGPDLEMEF